MFSAPVFAHRQGSASPPSCSANGGPPRMSIENTTSPPTHAPAGAAAAAKETLEDYTLRFAPRSYRRWGTGTVAISALGGIAYLADFAIGANIGISYGTVNALWGIAVFAVVIFATGIPL